MHVVKAEETNSMDPESVSINLHSKILTSAGNVTMQPCTNGILLIVSIATRDCQMSTPAMLWVHPACLWAGIPPVHLVFSLRSLILGRSCICARTPHTQIITHALLYTHVKHSDLMKQKLAAHTNHSMFPLSGRLFCVSLYSDELSIFHKHTPFTAPVRCGSSYLRWYPALTLF